MAPRLKFLTVEDFRSIRGPVAVSLDAPAVLIHGPNGTGKTSLLSAIELALTGSVPSLARLDDGYMSYLPHKLAKSGLGRVSIQAEGAGAKPEASVVANGVNLVGTALLDDQHARFYVERCYLAQATLGRLLEIYEHQDNRSSTSPLTRFVKEMLGLDALDALIDGLNAVGDVRRFRETAPRFWAARSNTSKLEQAVKEARDLEKGRWDEVMAIEVVLRQLLGSLWPQDKGFEIPPLRALLEHEITEHEARLVELARIRRNVAAARDQMRDELASDQAGERIQVEQASSTAREALARWRATAGTQLNAIFATLQKRFPNVTLTEADPGASYATATATVKAALERTRTALTNDDVLVRSLADLQVSVRQGQGRLEQIDQQLANVGGANRDLAEALSAITSHIEGESCPVCGRDFGEISPKPLAAHVSEEVARLVSAAGRVEALVRDRAVTSTAVAAAQRQEADFLARRLPTKRRDDLIVEQAELTEWMNSLEGLVDDARAGSQLMRGATHAAQRLSLLNSRQSSITGLRAELALHGEQLSLQPYPPDMPLQQIVSEMLAEVGRLSAREAGLKESRDQADQTLSRLEESRQKAEEASLRLAMETSRRQQITERRHEAERRVSVAKDLLSRAQALRAGEVRRIFNGELNLIWRDLFIRLAPDEAFVPAFALPSVPGSPVEAVLETHYRTGGKGGNPRAMLSAGNLNTAALTLFLGLHLSVSPMLPWLVLDDPVQSMDDVHIAQFAALLRTLKQHGRQVVIAVHDRQLFDYLTLELSPTFNGDRLITIELGRDSDGMTTAPWKLMAYQPDRAIAA